MSPEELRAKIAGAPDADALRGVVQACAARLRGPHDDDRVGLVAELLPLLRHDSERVRRAMADACDAFPGAMFDEAAEVLAGDGDHFVCGAARRAAERRAQQRETAKRCDAADHLSAEVAGEIAERHGDGALALARRLARREVEQYLERMHHETTKLDAAIDRAAESIDAELANARPSVAALRARMGALREGVSLQRSLHARARDYARQVRGVFAPESLASIVEEAGDQLGARLGERRGRLDLVTGVEGAISLHVDRHALLQALQNLLQNAVEAYGAEAARMTVTVTGRLVQKGTKVAIQIEDRGAGMSEERQRSLFIPFRSSKPGGSGIGLLMARKMVEEVHGGTLAIESAPGVGTTVVLTLPARQADVRRRR